MIKTDFGEFSETELVAIVKCNDVGNTYVFKGYPIGTRVNEKQQQFLIIRNENGELYDVAPGFYKELLIGQEANNVSTENLRPVGDGTAEDDMLIDSDDNSNSNNCDFSLPKYNRI